MRFLVKIVARNRRFGQKSKPYNYTQFPRGRLGSKVTVTKLYTLVTPGLLQKNFQKSVTVREFVTVRGSLLYYEHVPNLGTPNMLIIFPPLE